MKIKKNIIFILVSLLFAMTSSAQNDTSTSKVEELIIWKFSDELKLSLGQEQSFAKLFRSLNAQKINLIATQAEHLKGADKLKTANQKNSWIKRYQGLVEQISSINIREGQEMLKILGPDKYIQYVSLKSDISQRVKGLIMTPDKASAEKAKLPPAKVIEE